MQMAHKPNKGVMGGLTQTNFDKWIAWGQAESQEWIGLISWT